MDYMTSTFSFDQIDELFQSSSSSMPLYDYQCRAIFDELNGILNGPSPPNRNDLAPEDHLGGCPPPTVEPLAVPLGSTPDEHPNPTAINEKRKGIHRNVERQRRQEMTSLYGSLRSRLPPHLLMGKRSISDHIHQATGYIKSMQRRIQKLRHKRDELKKVSGSNKTIDPIKNKEKSPLTYRCQDTVVKIEPCIGGLETTITTDLRCGVALSKVIGVFIREGMNVISCTSTVANKALLHSIKSEVITDDGRATDMLSTLKAKLMSLSEPLQ